MSLKIIKQNYQNLVIKTSFSFIMIIL